MCKKCPHYLVPRGSPIPGSPIDIREDCWARIWHYNPACWPDDVARIWQDHGKYILVEDYILRTLQSFGGIDVAQIHIRRVSEWAIINGMFDFVLALPISIYQHIHPSLIVSRHLSKTRVTELLKFLPMLSFASDILCLLLIGNQV